MVARGVKFDLQKKEWPHVAASSPKLVAVADARWVPLLLDFEFSDGLTNSKVSLSFRHLATEEVALQSSPCNHKSPHESSWKGTAPSGHRGPCDALSRRYPLPFEVKLAPNFPKPRKTFAGISAFARALKNPHSPLPPSPCALAQRWRQSSSRPSRAQWRSLRAWALLPVSVRACVCRPGRSGIASHPSKNYCMHAKFSGSISLLLESPFSHSQYSSLSHLRSLSRELRKSAVWGPSVNLDPSPEARPCNCHCMSQGLTCFRILGGPPIAQQWLALTSISQTLRLCTASRSSRATFTVGVQCVQKGMATYQDSLQSKRPHRLKYILVYVCACCSDSVRYANSQTHFELCVLL